MKVDACARLNIMQVRPGYAFVLEWNLPFRNPGSATVPSNTTRGFIPAFNSVLKKLSNRVAIDM